MDTVSIAWDVKSILLLVAGIFVCVLWFLLIGNYKQLNSAKFDIINEIEKELPTRPFSDEWGKLKLNRKYVEGTKLERCLPIMFISLYIGTIIVIFSIK